MELTEPEGVIERHSMRCVEEALGDTPVVVIQGARQVGKSTLATLAVERRGGRLLSLDDAPVLDAITRDPDAVIGEPTGHLLVFDEVQRAPWLLRSIKAAVDKDRRPGRFLITGSADLLHVAGANESLAGRAETVELFGLSLGEQVGRFDDFIGAVLGLGGQPPAGEPLSRSDYAALLAAGGYPEAVRREGRRRSRWFSSYLSRVTDHDAAEVSGLRDLDRLDRLLSLVAANNSGELVAATLARNAQIPETSVAPYLRLLRDLYLVASLPAWGGSLTSRVVRRPKAFILDTGLACHLAGLDAQALASATGSDRLGPMLESFVAGELWKQRTWSEVDYRLGHFRDRAGLEVDLIAELPGGRIIAIETKAVSSPAGHAFDALAKLRDRLGDRFVAGLLLHTGEHSLPHGDRIWSAPVSALWGAPA